MTATLHISGRHWPFMLFITHYSVFEAIYLIHLLRKYCVIFWVKINKFSCYYIYYTLFQNLCLITHICMSKVEKATYKEIVYLKMLQQYI